MEALFEARGVRGEEFARGNVRGEESHADESHGNRYDTLDNEDPLPALEALREGACKLAAWTPESKNAPRCRRVH